MDHLTSVADLKAALNDFTAASGAMLSSLLLKLLKPIKHKAMVRVNTKRFITISIYNFLNFVCFMNVT